MTKSAAVKQNQGYFSTLPLGSIIAWHRDIDPDNYLPPLPPGWAECNGQVLDDPESILHNQKIPDLNGEGRFLRGGQASGNMQAQDWKSFSVVSSEGSYTHDETTIPKGGFNSPRIFGGKWEAITINNQLIANQLGFRFDASEVRPVNMSIIWIIKVKQVVAVSAVAAVAAESNAPHGAVYVSKDGNVGIGTSKPEAKLHVNGSLEANGITGLTFITELPPDFRDTKITTARGWIPTTHTISLDSAGTWLVLYTVRVFRNAGDRGDMSELRLTTQTGGETMGRSFPGVFNATIQTSGTINVTHVFVISDPDTVTVEIRDGSPTTLADLDLNGAHFTAIRLR